MTYKKNELGRSMVEMLGVLMILAVVSVAGLVTYDYAKKRWWETETGQVITKIFSLAKSKTRNVTAHEMHLALPRGITSIKTENVGILEEGAETETATPFRKVVLTFDPAVYDCDAIETCEQFDVFKKFGFVVSAPYTQEYIQGDITMKRGVVDLMMKADSEALSKIQKQD